MFIREHGGNFDTFAESWQHVGGMRDTYDQMEEVIARTRTELDEKVSGKKEFVRNVRSTGDDVLADMIESMFGVKKSLLSRILRGR